MRPMCFPCLPYLETGCLNVRQRADIQYELPFLFITGTPNSSIISDALNVFGFIWNQR